MPVTDEVNGRRYFDTFKVVLDKVRSSDPSFARNTGSFLRRFKQEFSMFPKLLTWKTGIGRETSDRGGRSEPTMEGALSTAFEGNTLEALNLTLNNCEDLRMDRGFPYTGTNIVVITAGNGVMRVDRQLANVTQRRIIDSGMCE